MVCVLKILSEQQNLYTFVVLLLLLLIENLKILLKIKGISGFLFDLNILITGVSVDTLSEDQKLIQICLFFSFTVENIIQITWKMGEESWLLSSKDCSSFLCVYD